MKILTTILVIILTVGCNRQPQPNHPEPTPAVTHPFTSENRQHWQDPANTQTATWYPNDTLEINYGESVVGLRWMGPLPTPPYELSLQARRTDGVDFFCGLTFPVRAPDENVTLILGGWGGAQVGISSVDDLDATENQTAQIIAFKQGQWQDIHLTVSTTHIKVRLNNQQIINLPLEGKTLSLRPGPIESYIPLSLTTFQTTAEFKNLTWRQLKN